LKKSFFITIILAFCLPCLVFAYHFLDNRTSSGGFAGEMWANTPVTIIIDGGTLEGMNGKPIVEDACAVWDSVPAVKKLCGNITTFPLDVTVANIEETPPTIGAVNVIFDETGDILAFLGSNPEEILGTCSNVLKDVTTGEISHSVMILNGSKMAFGDLLGTTIHELGHCWGLAHTPIGGISTDFPFNTPGLDPIPPSKTPTMVPVSLNELWRTLEDDDKAGITILYPQN